MEPRLKYISYRVPEAGLNQLSVSIAHEFKAVGLNITVLAIDPGNVPTKLSKWQGETSVEVSARGIYKVIQDVTFEDSGKFLT
jgi:NAD(P)-dependent dehydrogenase (short-subunit alcohol dehydrogenase family)